MIKSIIINIWILFQINMECLNKYINHSHFKKKQKQKFNLIKDKKTTKNLIKFWIKILDSHNKKHKKLLSLTLYL